MIAGWIDRWLLAPAPATRLAALRVAVGGYAVVFLLARWPSFWSAPGLEARQFEPVGPLWWMDAPVAPGLARAALVALVPLGVLFVLGVAWRATGPLFALGFFAVAAYRLSWGHVIHSEHLPALHLLVVGFAPAADAWRVRRRHGAADPATGEAGDAGGGRPGAGIAGDDDRLDGVGGIGGVDRLSGIGMDEAATSGPGRTPARYGFPIRLMSVILVVTYLLAGWMKLRNGGWDWVSGDVLRNQIAYDNLRKELLGSPHSPVGGWLVGHPWVFPPMAWGTVAVELGAPLALLGGRLRSAWAFAAWLFHVGIVIVMAISFPYQVAGIAYLCLFRTEVLVQTSSRSRWWRSATSGWARRRTLSELSP